MQGLKSVVHGMHNGLQPLNSTNENSLLPFVCVLLFCLSVSTDFLHKNSKLLKTFQRRVKTPKLLNIRTSW